MAFLARISGMASDLTSSRAAPTIDLEVLLLTNSSKRAFTSAGSAASASR